MRAIFSTWRRLKTMHRRSVLSTFHFFCFTKINENMIQTTEQNWYLEKHRKMKPEGSQNGPKIAENWWGKYRKYWKLRPKHENWGCVFWMIFWHTATIQKILEKRPERRKSDRPGGMSKPLGRIIGGFWDGFGDGNKRPEHPRKKGGPARRPRWGGGSLRAFRRAGLRIQQTRIATDQQSNKPTNQQSNNPTQQSTNPPTHQPNNPTTQQPNNPTTQQPTDNQTTQQPNNPETKQPNNSRIQEPKNPTTQQPNKPTTQKTDSPPKNKNKKTTKMAPNRSQGDPKWSQNWPKMEPKSTKMRWNAQSSCQEGASSMMVTPLGWFLGPLGVPKIDQKSILGPKRGARKRFFIDFSREKRFSHFWAWFFHQYLMNIGEQLNAIF